MHLPVPPAAIFAAVGAAGASAVLRSNHRLGRAGTVHAAAASLVGGGLVIAATVGDNHVLALGLGALCGRAAEDTRRDAFRRTVVLVAGGGLLAMAVRSLAG